MISLPTLRATNHALIFFFFFTVPFFYAFWHETLEVKC